MNFVYQGNNQRVVFAAGARSRAGEELDLLGVSRAMIITTPPQADSAASFARLIGDRASIVYPGAQMYTPTNVTEGALTAVSSVKADGILVIGGGTAIGLSKAIAFRTDLPQLVIPTTFAGSEMTRILEEVERGIKKTQRSPKVLPETVIYDPELVAGLPLRVVGPSAMTAMAHAIDALCAVDANPISSLLAEEAIRALRRALPRLLAGPNEAAWADALYGACLAGTCLGTVAMGIHHKICHALGGAFDLSHADVHCILLPYTAAFNRNTASKAVQRVARALEGDDVPSALYDMMLEVETQPSLKALGLTRAALERAADLAMKNPCGSSSQVTREEILQILFAAYEGKRP
ncbi:maleylacetate reductase [Bradyrhizobium liaoningense]|uniref:maleylacetate reductase n=1 Tax=Bradyrhizobium liaoningense TaxID=43992 RepID=UPI001BA9DB8F|nr:maleylacetate reductase [Bradyrhizobium liaoningense]MBR0840404.1 maleylacetate reductase [Bradyrhizobium liaoningense]